MKQTEEIPRWWKWWLIATVLIAIGLFFVKGFWSAFFGTGAFSFFGSMLMCGRSDSQVNTMAFAFYFLFFVIFIIGFFVAF